MGDGFWWMKTDIDTDTDTDTNTGWILVKFPFKTVFPTAAVCAAVRHFYIAFLCLVYNPEFTNITQYPINDEQ